MINKNLFGLLLVFVVVLSLLQITNAQTITVLNEPIKDYNYDTCIFKHANFTIDLSQYYDPLNPTHSIRFKNDYLTYFNLCGNVNNKCSQYGPSAMLCYASYSVFSDRGQPFITITTDGISLGIPFPGASLTLLVKSSNSNEISADNTNIYIKTPKMIIKSVYQDNQSTLDFTSPIAVNHFTSTIKIYGEFIKSLPTTLPTPIEIKVYSNKSLINSCDQIILDRDQGYLSCTNTPTGRELLNILYRLELTMGTNIGYHNFYYIGTKEIKREPLNADWDKCIFNNTNYRVDLSNYTNSIQGLQYTPGGVQSGIFYFTLCGNTKINECSSSIPCFKNYGYTFYFNKSPDLLIDEEGMKLYVTFKSMNNFYLSIPMEIKLGTTIDYYVGITNRIIVVTPALYINTFLPFTLDKNTYPRIPGSRMSISGEFIKSLPLVLSDPLNIKVYDNYVLHHECTDLIIDRNQGKIDCLDNPTGSEKLNYKYKLVVTLGSNAQGDANFQYLDPQVIRKSPISIIDFDNCIFKHDDYVFDLSKVSEARLLYSYKYIGYTNSFKVCGNPVVPCPGVGCFTGSTLNFRKVYLKLDTEGLKLVFEYYISNDRALINVEIKPVSGEFYADASSYTNAYIYYSNMKITPITREPMIDMDFNKCIFSTLNYTIDLSNDYNISNKTFEISNNFYNTVKFNICGNKNIECNGKPSCVSIYDKKPYLLKDDEGIKLLIQYTSNTPFSFTVTINNIGGNDGLYSCNGNYCMSSNDMNIIKPNLDMTISPTEILRSSKQLTINGLFIHDIPIDNTIPIDIKIYKLGGEYLKSCNQIQIDRDQGSIICETNFTGLEVINSKYKVILIMGNNLGIAHFTYRDPKVYQSTKLNQLWDKCIFSDGQVTYNLTNIYENQPYHTINIDSYSQIGKINFRLCGGGYSNVCSSSSPIFNDRECKGVICESYVNDNEDGKSLLFIGQIQGSYLPNLRFELSFANDSSLIFIESEFKVYMTTSHITQSPSLQIDIIDPVPIMKSTITLKGKFTNDLVLSNTDSIVVDTSGGLSTSQPPTNQTYLDCTNIQLYLDYVTCELDPTTISKVYMTETNLLIVSMAGHIGILPFTFRVLNSKYYPIYFIDYKRCLYVNLNYTIDLSHFADTPIQFRSIDPPIILCGKNSNKYSYVSFLIDEEGIKLDFWYGFSVIVTFGQSYQMYVYEYTHNQKGRLDTPDFKIYQTSYKSLQDALPRWKPSTLKLTGDYIQKATIAELSNTTINIYGPTLLEPTKCLDIKVEMNQGSGSYLSCLHTPNGRESNDTYIAHTIIGNNSVIYSFTYSNAKELSREPMTKFDYNTCVFTSREFTIDLSAFYNPNDPPLNMVETNNQTLPKRAKICGYPFFCGTPYINCRESTREAYFIRDEEATKLLIVYHWSKKYEIEVKIGNSFDNYLIADRGFIITPQMVIKPISSSSIDSSSSSDDVNIPSPTPSSPDITNSSSNDSISTGSSITPPLSTSLSLTFIIVSFFIKLLFI